MSTDYSILNDQFVDMAFITKLTGLTDKWFLSKNTMTKMVLYGFFQTTQEAFKQQLEQTH